MPELNVGGSNMTVELRGDTNTISATADTGNKQWVAVIGDTHPKYNYDRDFVAYQKPRTSDRDSGTATVEDGAVIEYVRFTHSGKNRSDNYYQLVDGELHAIEEADITAALDGAIIPDVAPEPRDVDFDALTPAVSERHVCDACGDTFETPHGLSIHEGMVHTDDESDDDTAARTEAPTQPVATDGGVVADGGGDEPDWDVVAGSAPARDGGRRIVSMDEAETEYAGRTFEDELLGIDLTMQSMSTQDTIQSVRVKPQMPKRGREAPLTGWIARLAVEEGGYGDLYDDEGDADDPLPGYEAETTGDYRQANPEDPRGDGVYRRDTSSDSPLTDQIADVVTREGGRIPVDFSAMVQNEGYARSRDWTVYAPERNPHRVAAAVTDLLNDTDGVSEVRVSVSRKSASDIATSLRASRVGYAFDDDEQDLIERVLREYRWVSGLPNGRRYVLDSVPSEARERVLAEDLRDMGIDYDSKLKGIARHPGDAWEYHEVTIHINEDADDPYYG